ncbi:MAG: hypothetical protein FWC32_04390 [Firmicutes bacterium]|nr:hypothetical protein [Bacillota bacterium]
MNWKNYATLLICFTIVLTPLFALELHSLILVVFTMFVGYQVWQTIRLYRMFSIVDKHCDPVRFLEKFKSSPMIFPNMYRAISLSLAGRYQDSYELVIATEPHKRRDFGFKVAYHVLLMSYYLDKNDMENATVEYKNLIKLRRRSFLPQLNMSIDLSVAEYHYKLNVTDDTTKYFLAQVRYLYSIYVKKLSLRHKLAFKYYEADLLEKLGDIKGALSLYGKIAEVGNTLHFAEISRKKLLELKTETGQTYE